MIFAAIFPPSIFSSYFLKAESEELLNMCTASNWISQTGSTKKYALLLLRLLLFNILKSNYLSSRIIFRAILTKKKKHSFHN